MGWYTNPCVVTSVTERLALEKYKAVISNAMLTRHLVNSCLHGQLSLCKTHKRSDPVCQKVVFDSELRIGAPLILRSTEAGPSDPMAARETAARVIAPKERQENGAFRIFEKF